MQPWGSSSCDRRRQPGADGRIQAEEWDEWVMGGRADVWGPPCLPTMSSSLAFFLSVCLCSTFWLHSVPGVSFFLSLSPFCCCFSPLPLPATFSALLHLHSPLSVSTAASAALLHLFCRAVSGWNWVAVLLCLFVCGFDAFTLTKFVGALMGLCSSNHFIPALKDKGFKSMTKINRLTCLKYCTKFLEALSAFPLLDIMGLFESVCQQLLCSGLGNVCVWGVMMQKQ